jgi:Protein of unknown function (DUF2752)
MTFRLVIFFTILTAAAGLSLLYFYFPASGHDLYPGCALYSLTGIYCPACGSQRAFSAILHGHLLRAFHDNALFVVALFCGLAFFLYQLRLVFTNSNKTSSFSIAPKTWWLLLGIILVFWIIRNLPIYPFTELAPLS